MKKLSIVIAVAMLAACARPVAPEGGPKDAAPPKVVPAKSTPNNATRFTGRSFELAFDEWVTLQEVGTQVLVSPPLAKRPEVTLKGRTVTFRFDKDEVLRPNTTYTINFGNAVKDLHEGNAAQDLRFVFSTGDFLDSLSVSGIVVDAFTNDPVENITVLLYDNLEDSVVYRERPYYMARTDKSGQFQIPNVRTGIFKCVAIDDADQNLKWNGEAERIGFPASNFTVQADSLRPTPAIRLFQSAPAMRLLAQSATQYGLIRLGYGQSPDTVALQPDAPGIRWLRTQEQDTLVIWYDNPDSTAWKLIAGTDTIAVRALARTAFLQQHRLVFGDEPVAGTGRGRGRNAQPTAPVPQAPLPPPRTINVRAGKPVLIPFNAPIAEVDTTLCRFLVDSLDVRDFALALDSAADPSVLRLDSDWQGGQRCTLTLLPGALTDFWGTTNADTLIRVFIVPSEKQLATLALVFENLKPGTPYIARLMSGNKAEEAYFFTADEPTNRLVLAGLVPAAYSVQLIEDTNGNRRWDPGDYLARQQPERVFLKKLDPLRANWEVEVTVQAATESAKRQE